MNQENLNNPLKGLRGISRVVKTIKKLRDKGYSNAQINKMLEDKIEEETPEPENND